ncbi:MAG: tetratricopeptide repeat protein [Bacteroidota bacterium]
MKYLIKVQLVLYCLFLTVRVSAQKVAAYANPEMQYQLGLELFNKNQFVSAQNCFHEYMGSSKLSLLKSDATFYHAACAIEVFNKDGEWLMKRFVELNPASTKLNTAYFYLAKSAYRKKKYKETLDNFDKVDVYQLDKDQLAELHFKRGYSFLQLNQFEKAKQDFFDMKELDSKYKSPAIFYYSHLSYQEKKYEVALQGFNRLVNDETFGSSVPYYITQIYFIQGKFDKVTKEAPKLLMDSANIKKEGEINRMIGESYFNLKDFANSIVYLKRTELGSGLNVQGNYVLGYCYYKTNDCKSAVANFVRATEGNDSIAQNAWYHMGDCYIKLGEKLKAKNAFYSAYQNGFDTKISEDALFSFAKLCYELDFSPYNEAVKSFNKYLKEYPDSPRRDECYKILVNVYSTTKNYEQAIKSIESFETIDPVLRITYQKLIYFKGVENFNNSNLDEAEKQLKKALYQNADPLLNSLSQYWLAEISYLRKDYSTAIDLWKKFQLTQGATQLKEFDLSNYALGYAYFQRNENGDFASANIAFRKFLLSNNRYDVNKVTDATLRAADCYFMNRDFAQASEFYKKGIDLNRLDVDYALYQKALCDGLSKNYTDKISELKRIENKFQGSNYITAALNELAETYYNNLKDYDNAIVYFERILKSYPNSSYANDCYAQLGNIYYERKQDDKAFEYYDKFVKQDAKSDAAKDVLEAIKKIFETKGDIEGMEKYFAAIGNPLSENQLEKASYAAAYDAYYTQKNCDLAMPKWEVYLSKFPNGRYVTEAQFNMGECAYNKSNYDLALKSYSLVIQKSRGIYSETALAKATFLLYKDKKYEAALPLYLQLQDIGELPNNKITAKIGAMRCAFYVNNFETALTQANLVINLDKLSPQQLSEAKYIKAKSLYETNRLDDALIEFKAMTKNAKNASGAEAYYFIAKIQYAKQDYKEVEKTVTKLVGYEYSNDDWNNKGMLLLADAYIAKGEDVDAEVILVTLINSKPRQEYMDEATRKLEAIKLKRQAEQAKPTNTVNSNEGDMQIQFNQSKSDSALYDNSSEEIKKLDLESKQPAEEPK